MVSGIFYYTSIAPLFLLVALKISDHWYHLYWVNSENSRLSFATASKRWQEMELVTPGSGGDTDFFRCTGWPVTAALLRLRWIPRRVIFTGFRLPTLVGLQTAALVTCAEPLALECGLYLMYILLWSHALHLITSRLRIGHFEHYLGAVKLRTQWGDSLSDAELRRRAVSDFLKVLVGFFLCSVVGFAGIFCALNTLRSESFRDAVMAPHSATFPDVLYFSITTITTVGFGDIVPTTREARFFVASEVLLGLSLVVLLVSLFGFSTDEEIQKDG